MRELWLVLGGVVVVLAVVAVVGYARVLLARPPAVAPGHDVHRLHTLARPSGGIAAPTPARLRRPDASRGPGRRRRLRGPRGRARGDRHRGGDRATLAVGRHVDVDGVRVTLRRTWSSPRRDTDDVADVQLGPASQAQ